MALELRPSWCVDDELVARAIELGPWENDGQVPITAHGGDDWVPGQGLKFRRRVLANGEPDHLRQMLGLRPGASVGVAARWYCRRTGLAGVHVGGPAAVAIGQEFVLEVDVPSAVGGSIELETCLTMVSGAGPTVAPTGGLLWSDSWSLGPQDRTALLEGEELRIPVRTVDFKARFGGASSALWAIDADRSILPEDLVSNVVAVLLNREVIEREFGTPGTEELDLSQMPKLALAGISVDLVRTLTDILGGELDSSEDWLELPGGTVGALLALRLAEAFGSVAEARSNYLEDPAAFTRGLWNLFAPARWRS